MTDLFYPHPQSLLLLLLPFFITIAVQSNNISNLNCLSYTCGDVNISYPFWRKDTESRNQFCGYKGFGIKCSEDNISEISLGHDSYYVKKIIYDYNGIVLVDRDVVSSEVPGPDNCPRVRHGINLETLPFNFSKHSVNLSFHYNCEGSPSFSFAKVISCMGDTPKKSYVHVVNTSTEETNWDECSCEQEVVTTVFNEFYDRSPDLSKFRELLQAGFELQWRRMDDCDKCEESGGWCGHRNKTGFICFCSDGTPSKGHCKAAELYFLFNPNSHVNQGPPKEL